MEDGTVNKEIEDTETLRAKVIIVTQERDTLKIKVNGLEQRVEEITKENQRLRNLEFAESSLEQDNNKVDFYTGLPSFTLLLHVFNLCKDYVPTSHRNKLTPFQEFMVVMLRLRLNLLIEDLAYRFQVSQPTISRIMTKWLEVMSLRLKSLLVWPDRETLRKTMPECFKKDFGTTVALIIDCFELFIERPSNLLAKAGTWSSCKHHNTVKFLIGITPQGTICYISQADPGRTHDDKLEDECGILEKMTPGDAILSDRGFRGNTSSADVLRVRIVQPAYLYGRVQLSGEEVDSTRRIAYCRIHVEHLIGLVRRKYRILTQLLPTDSLKVKENQLQAPVDQIAIICCALCNLCPPIVPMFEKEEV
ncbi:hypothetical protein ONE63_004530 [Megalurothrips usitatus]|uniref:Uncharacterized protein n=1 Tax=Megalurothrips usitatus TaxID=439358 RepID=A0AAV7X707_9NEOP|nr:hypothetical protein ONE63_004530 [Megalurothrips usitatus]